MFESQNVPLDGREDRKFSGSGTLWSSKEYSEDVFGSGNLFQDEDAETLADSVDEFTAFLFSMPLVSASESTQSVDLLSVKKPAMPLPHISASESLEASQPFAVPPVKQPAIFQVPSLADSVLQKHVSTADTAREYRKLVAIPRYLRKRSRRKWVHELMHPSRSAAAARRQRIGGKFDVVSKDRTSVTIAL